MPICLSRLLCVVLEKTLCREDKNMGWKGKSASLAMALFPCDYKLPPESPVYLVAAPSELHLHYFFPYPLLSKVSDGLDFNTFWNFDFSMPFVCFYNSSPLCNYLLIKVFSFDSSEVKFYFLLRPWVTAYKIWCTFLNMHAFWLADWWWEEFVQAEVGPLLPWGWPLYRKVAFWSDKWAQKARLK